MGLKFNPPAEKAPKYAVYVESYRPSFRTFTRMSDAKQSFYYQTNLVGWFRNSALTSYDAKILEFIDGDWYVRYDVPQGTKKSDLPWIGQYGQTLPFDVEEYVKFRIAVHDEKKFDRLRQTISIEKVPNRVAI